VRICFRLLAGSPDDKAGLLDTSLNAAEALLDLVDDDPSAALEQAERIIGEASDVGDPAAAAIAGRAKGRALLYMGRVDAALAAFDAAVEVAESSGEARLAALARMSMAGPLTHAGRPAEALEQLDRAAAVLTGAEAGVLEMQRAQVLQRQVPSAETQRQAEASLAMAEQTFRLLGDVRMQAQALNSWGLHYAFQGRTVEAATKLEAARRLYSREGLEASVADMDNNLGWVAALGGDFAAAEARFADADAEFRRLGMPLGELRNDRCTMLLSAGLAAEARALAATTASELDAAGAAADAAETMLLYAHASLVDQDPSAAEMSARRARRAFAAQHRPGWRWQARILELTAATASGRARKADRVAAERMAQRSQAAGLRTAALQAHLTAGRIAATRGESAIAELHLAEAKPFLSRAPLEYRVEYRAVEAAHCLASGNPAGAARAAAEGLNTLDRYQALAGATDIRAHLRTFGADLGELGLRLAVASGTPSRVFSWMERTRAGTMRFTPARPPADAALAAELTGLRGLVAEIREAEIEGDDPTDLLQKQSRLQEAIRHRSRQRSPGAHAEVAHLATPVELRSVLHERILVSLAETEDELVAVIMAGRSRLIRLGAAAPILAEATALRSALNRLARPDRSERSREADRAAALHAAATLDHRLQPLRLGDAPLVLVPPPSLAALPWALLPSLQDRPIVVAPSADLWYRRQLQPTPKGDHVVLAAGPDLQEAAGELRSIGRYYPEAIRFTPRRSRAAEVAGALDGATVAHLACHGSFRPDNPMFSSLEFGDGPLFVHDLEQIDRSPEVVVLSACESGLSAGRPGNEMLGLAASLLAPRWDRV